MTSNNARLYGVINRFKGNKINDIFKRQLNKEAKTKFKRNKYDIK